MSPPPVFMYVCGRRALSMVPAVGLFVGNMVCMCLSLVQSATNRQKARMKTMLTVNAVSEVCRCCLSLSSQKLELLRCVESRIRRCFTHCRAASCGLLRECTTR